MRVKKAVTLGIFIAFTSPLFAFANDGTAACPATVRTPDSELKNACEVTFTVNKVQVEKAKCQGIFIRGALLNSSAKIPIQWDNTGLPLAEVKPGVWSTKVKLPEGETLQFKFIKSKSKDGNYVDDWEGADDRWADKANRTLQISCKAKKDAKPATPEAQGARIGKVYEADWDVLAKQPSK